MHSTIMIKGISVCWTGVADVVKVVQHLFGTAKVHHISHAQDANLIEQLENVRPRLVYGEEDQFTSACDIAEVRNEVVRCVAV